MAELGTALVEAYNSSRNISKPQHLCHAPFANMYFNVSGEAAPCWLTFFEAPKFPEKSIREIWFGEFYENIRSLIKKNDLSERCRVCERNIRNQLFLNPLARAYDNDYSLERYPKIMEFELSNQCNLECVMCNGRLSSSIRKNRDQLSPYTSPYNQSFVEQLGEFLPHLKEARFNGGEPFLQPICWEIWNKIAIENPEIEITVATNGTVWSSKVEEILNRAKFRINLSLDGFSSETYESIRKNAKFHRVMENVHRFGAYCKKNNRIFSIMINPMRVNYWEMPAMVEFCNSNGYYLWFNTVYRPFHLSLWNLPSSELKIIHQKLSKAEFGSSAESSQGVVSGNIAKYQNFVERQITTWIREQEAREAAGTDELSRMAKRAAAKPEFLSALRAGLSSKVEIYPVVERKISEIFSKMKNNIDETVFYSLLLGKPIDWVLHDLEHKSVEQMILEFYSLAEYY